MVSAAVLPLCFCTGVEPCASFFLCLVFDISHREFRQEPQSGPENGVYVIIVFSRMFLHGVCCVRFFFQVP